MAHNSVHARQRIGMGFTVLFDDSVIHFLLQRGNLLGKGVISVESTEGGRRVESFPLLKEVLPVDTVGNDVIMACIRALVPLAICPQQRVGVAQFRGRESGRNYAKRWTSRIGAEHRRKRRHGSRICQNVIQRPSVDAGEIKGFGVREEGGVHRNRFPLLDPCCAILVPICDDGLFEGAGLEYQFLQRSSESPGRDECELFRESKFFFVTEVEDLPQLKKGGAQAEVPAELLALVVVPRSLVAGLCQKADNITAHVTRTREPLATMVFRVAHDL